MSDDVEDAPKPEPTKEEVNAVKDLSERDIKWREKYKLSVSELEAIKLQNEKETKELNDKLNGELSKVAEQNKILQETAINTKIEAEAVAAGIKDVELTNLIDRKDIKLNENGQITGVSEAIAAFKARKPDFFGADRKVSSSTNAPIPDVPANNLQDAWSLSKEEFTSRMRRGIF